MALTEASHRVPTDATTDARPELSAPELSAEELTRIVLASLDDDKAEDVLVIDLNEKSSVADAMIIASGRSQRHVGAVADHLIKALKDSGFGRAKVEGLPACDWVLVDAGDVIVHLFRPEVRAYYNLEKMWGEEPYVLRAAEPQWDVEAEDAEDALRGD